MAKKFLCSLALFALLTIAPQGMAAQTDTLAQEELFLGEAVPLRSEGVGLEELARRRLSAGPEDTVQCWWVSPQGRRELSELAGERPRQDTDYHIAAVIEGEEGDRWLDLLYRVTVVSGTVQVRVEGPCAVEGGSALFCLEGGGLCLYREASLDADPLSGKPMLKAEFTGLPFGIYTAAAVGAGEEAEVCRLGVRAESDTIDPKEHTAVLTFTLDQTPALTLGESFKLGGPYEE